MRYFNFLQKPSIIRVLLMITILFSLTLFSACGFYGRVFITPEENMQETDNK